MNRTDRQTIAFLLVIAFFFLVISVALAWLTLSRSSPLRRYVESTSREQERKEASRLERKEIQRRESEEAPPAEVEIFEPGLPSEEEYASMLDRLGLSGITELDLVKALQAAYDAKLANPEYLEWMNRKGLPTGFQDYDEEKAIKGIRSALARNNPVPDARIELIPFSEIPPKLDGRIEPGEWEGALRMEIGSSSDEPVSLFLRTDGRFLFLAADVSPDRTESGWDQLRFYYHLGLGGLIKNERVHIERNGGAFAIRETNVRWKGEPPRNENENWKKYPLRTCEKIRRNPLT